MLLEDDFPDGHMISFPSLSAAAPSLHCFPQLLASTLLSSLPTVALASGAKEMLQAAASIFIPPFCSKRFPLLCLGVAPSPSALPQGRVLNTIGDQSSTPCRIKGLIVVGDSSPDTLLALQPWASASLWASVLSSIKWE